MTVCRSDNASRRRCGAGDRRRLIDRQREILRSVWQRAVTGGQRNRVGATSARSGRARECCSAVGVIDEGDRGRKRHASSNDARQGVTGRCDREAAARAHAKRGRVRAANGWRRGGRGNRDEAVGSDELAIGVGHGHVFRASGRSDR